MPLSCQHLEDDLVPVDLEKPVGRDAQNGDLAAIVHRVDHVAEGNGGAPDISRPDIEAFLHADAFHDVAQVFLRGIDDMMHTQLAASASRSG
jgi:hypothetical protein